MWKRTPIAKSYRPTRKGLHHIRQTSRGLHTHAVERRSRSTSRSGARGDEIGAGAFGTVYSATLHGEPVAVKSVIEDPRVRNREAVLCQELMTSSHPNIVKYFNVRHTVGVHAHPPARTHTHARTRARARARTDPACAASPVPKCTNMVRPSRSFKCSFGFQ